MGSYEPACGCEAACGIGPGCGCGCDAPCDCGPSCGYEPSCGCALAGSFEPSCGCAGGCGGGCGGGGGWGYNGWGPFGAHFWHGWGPDWGALRAGWIDCGPLLRPWFGGGCGCGSCDGGCSGCGELYVDEWISDPPACCDPCPGPRPCGNCAMTPLGAKMRGCVSDSFARRKQDWINSGFMCDTDRCRTHSSHAQGGCNCGQCAQAGHQQRGYARDQPVRSRNTRHAPTPTDSVGGIIQAAFTR
jgi:hypothetical protein